MYHPDSPFFDQAFTEALKAARSFIGDEYWEPETADLYDKFKESVLSPSERSLLVIKTKREERDLFLEKTPYNEDTFEMIEKLLGNTKKINDAYDEAERKLAREKEVETQGATIESAGEAGLF